MELRGGIWALVLVLLVSACGGDITQSEEYIELAAQRDGLISDLDELTSEAESLEDAVGSVTGDLANAEAALADAQQQLESLASSMSDVASLPVIPDDPQVVFGTATCDVLEDEGVAADGSLGTPVYVCELDMSDQRVSGTQRDDRFRRIDGGPAAFAWVFEESVITNAEGTWRGAIQAADNGVPCGAAHYVGEGAFEGLEFRYYFCDVNDGPLFRGWISDIK